MPFNLAVFNSNAANAVIERHSEIHSWTISGHSLGGVMASNFAKNNTGLIEGLILFASYPSENISKSPLKVLSIYGDLDGFVKQEKYEKSKLDLPSTAVFNVIKGGNHCNFGDYGFQDGDNQSTISKKQQQSEIILAVVNFLKTIK